MPSVPDKADSPPPSIFISYASADRAAARTLSETLAKAGLDVWLDEEELAGGEAWDAKIRQQIRTCTYFMPVISATTEARREGYFRREWRLAVERTLDLADDVTFLVPVVIDGTHDQGARVPEKFTAVQWLRCPAGCETAALGALARRLVAEHSGVHAPAPPPASAPPLLADAVPAQRSASAGSRAAAPARGFPEFPAFPAPGHRLRFVYDLVVWIGRTIAALWQRLPRWLRYLAMVVIVFKLIGWFFRSSRSPEDEATRSAVAANIGKAFSSADTTGDETARRVLQAAGAALDALQSGRPLAMNVFRAADPAVKGAAADAFGALHKKLASGGHFEQIAVSPAPFPAGADDAAILARATALKCRWLLTGTAHSEEAGEFTLEVKLYDTTAQKIVLRAERKGELDEGEAVGEKLAPEILAHITFDLPAEK